MATTYRQPGDVLPFTAPAGGTVNGLAVKIGSALGIAQSTAAVGVRFEMMLVGVHEVAKVSAQAWTEGQQINWDNTAKLFTTVTTGNFRAGVATAAAANPTATGFVRLNGVDVGAALA
jgi:predicted RecA/RadA family phage recombinase